MRVLIICRRELHSLFGSFIAWVLIAVFLVLSGYFFYSDLVFFVLFGGFTLPTGLWQFVFIDMRFVAMLVLPLATMRLFAEEKRLGTMELLWTYPVRDGEIVAGKFLAAWIFFLIMLAPTVLNPIVFYRLHPFDIGPLVGAYVGMILLGTAFIACGMFVSSLTEHQVLSAMGTYGILVLFWFVTWNEEIANQTVVRLLLGLSLFDHFYNFSRGVIDTRSVVYFVLFTALFLFLTWQSLVSRTWRGVR
jgi:gliding motility-associated transport system permease protein